MQNPLLARPGAFSLLALALLTSLLLASGGPAQRPTLYLIGDSTVRNPHAPQMGWGAKLPLFFDSTRLRIDNRAMAGRSTRTFVSEKRWRTVDSLLRPGDFLLMQFGHNEGSPPDTTKAGRRGVLPGTGPETKELTWPDGRHETVHTYGWYLRRFIGDAKARGVTPIVASMIPRNQWQHGKVKRASQDFGGWAREVARQEGVAFIDLNQRTADKYDQLGPDAVARLFAGDHTHTNEAGALINAASVAEGIRANKQLALHKYLVKQK